MFYHESQRCHSRQMENYENSERFLIVLFKRPEIENNPSEKRKKKKN